MKTEENHTLQAEKQEKTLISGEIKVLKANPNFNTNAPPFEVRGCKVILGGALYAEGGAVLNIIMEIV